MDNKKRNLHRAQTEKNKSRSLEATHHFHHFQVYINRCSTLRHGVVFTSPFFQGETRDLVSVQWRDYKMKSASTGEYSWKPRSNKKYRRVKKKKMSASGLWLRRPDARCVFQINICALLTVSSRCPVLSAAVASGRGAMSTQSKGDENSPEKQTGGWVFKSSLSSEVRYKRSKPCSQKINK